MDYKSKYLKYKTKYSLLKGGEGEETNICSICHRELVNDSIIKDNQFFVIYKILMPAMI